MEFLGCKKNYFFSGENDESFDILVRVNNRCESIMKWYYKISLGSYFVIIPVFALLSVLSNMNSDLDPTKLYRPYQLMWAKIVDRPDKSIVFWLKIIQFETVISLPWNEKTLAGYIVEIGVSYLLCAGYFLSYGQIVMLFIAMCLFHRAFSEMFQQFLLDSNHSDENRNDKMLICQLIRFHISTKLWVQSKYQKNSIAHHFIGYSLW